MPAAHTPTDQSLFDDLCDVCHTAIGRDALSVTGAYLIRRTLTALLTELIDRTDEIPGASLVTPDGRILRLHHDRNVTDWLRAFLPTPAYTGAGAGAGANFEAEAL